MECNNCGKDISPRANVCPRCGEPEPTRERYSSYSPSNEETSNEENRELKFQWGLTGIIIVGVAIWAICFSDLLVKEAFPVNIFAGILIGVIGGGFWGGGLAWLFTVFISIFGVFKD